MKLSEGPVQLSDCMNDMPSIHAEAPFTRVKFANTAPLILSDVYHIQKLMKCYINKMFNLKTKKSSIVIQTEL